MDTDIRYLPIFGDRDDLALVDHDDGYTFGSDWEAAEAINGINEAAIAAERLAIEAQRTANRAHLRARHLRTTGFRLLSMAADWDSLPDDDPEDQYIDESVIDLDALNAAIVADRVVDPPYGATCLDLAPDWWETVGGAV